MQYPTCRHVKADGAYCGSPALRDHKYCYYHLMERGRRLRRARALRENVPYRLDIPSLDNLYAIRNAITEVVQAVGSGQLDPRAAGKMLYGIQQVTSVNRRIEKMEAAQLEKMKDAEDAVPQVRAPLLGTNLGSHPDDNSRVHEYPGFENEFGLNPGADLDAETAFVLRKADADAELRQADPMPTPPLGLRPGSAAYRVYREEAYQGMQMQLNSMRAQLREYNEMKRQQVEKQIKEAEEYKKGVASAAPAPDRRTGAA